MGQFMVSTILLSALVWYGKGSSYIFAADMFSLAVALMLVHSSVGQNLNRQHLIWIYLGATTFQTIVIMEISMSLAKMFVPLTGRMGAEIPSDIIMAAVVALPVSFFARPFRVWSSYATSARPIVRNICLCATMLVLAALLLRPTYDQSHPKRFFIQSVDDLDTGSHYIDLAECDTGKGPRRDYELFAKHYGDGRNSNRSWECGPLEFALPFQSFHAQRAITPHQTIIRSPSAHTQSDRRS